MAVVLGSGLIFFLSSVAKESFAFSWDVVVSIIVVVEIGMVLIREVVNSVVVVKGWSVVVLYLRFLMFLSYLLAEE